MNRTTIIDTNDGWGWIVTAVVALACFVVLTIIITVHYSTEAEFDRCVVAYAHDVNEVGTFCKSMMDLQSRAARGR